MLLSVKNLSNYKIEANDGSIGHVHSFLFDDQNWLVRFLVVDTGSWLSGRKVLIAPSALGKPEGTIKVFPIELTREQVKGSPDIDTEKSVSRRQEIELNKYYNWYPYLGGMLGSVGTTEVPIAPALDEQGEQGQVVGVKTREKSNPHLRSSKELIGYKIHAEDGEIGHLEDFIVHGEDWIIRYIVVNTGNWLSGRKVIIPPGWLKDVSWADSEVIIDVSRETVKNSPEFNPAVPVNREYEIRLYDYYGRPVYWI
jgi:uncharacterized protein YrrD